MLEVDEIQLHSANTFPEIFFVIPLELKRYRQLNQLRYTNATPIGRFYIVVDG